MGKPKKNDEYKNRMSIRVDTHEKRSTVLFTSRLLLKNKNVYI